MTREEIDILLTPEMRDAVERNLGADPLKVALDRRVSHAQLAATQVKYLQRARTKLPSYYAARCIIPPLAFEQASSEKAAFMHDFGTGTLALDLTCGLGVDSFAMSRKFTGVIAVERDPVLAYLARINFGLLGADNIEIVNMTAEEFLSSRPGIEADLIYADPARRDGAGRKTVVLADCSPDAGALLPAMRHVARTVAVKLSPLFDVGEAVRIFGPGVRVEVISIDGECKEVGVETGGHIAGPLVAAHPAGFGRIEFPHNGATVEIRPVPDPATLTGSWLIAPDVALAKARIACRWFTGAGCAMETDNSYAFAATLPDPLPGRAYRIARAEPYSPKALKKILKESGISTATILKRDFPLDTARVLEQLGIREGGGAWLVLTRVGGRQWAFLVDPQ